MEDGGERIRWMREIRLPFVLTAAQLAVFPLGPMVSGSAVDPVRAWQVVAATVIVGVALSLRSVVPVAAWAVTVAVVTCADLFGLQDDAVVVPFGDLFGLYAVALRRTLRVSVLCAAGAAVVSTLLTTVGAASDPVTVVADAALSATVYAAVIVFGRSRRRRTARREAVRVHVAGAADQERAAAARERERLSQELHDVSAHHLTAVVVQLAAAQRLRDPAMTAQALDVARTSGREASRSLRRLVALAGRDDTPAPAGIADLVAGFARLGLRIDLHLNMDLDAAPGAGVNGCSGDGLDSGRPDGGAVHPDVAEAAHQIVQEALTNVLRYAPGAAVTVTLNRTGGAVTVAVEDAGDGGAAGFDLGSGAGIPGMRARAARLGGTLTAGPRQGGGWSVRAVLPGSPGSAARPAARAPAPAWWRGPTVRALDVQLIVLVAGLPVFFGAAARAEGGGGPLFAGPADAAMTALFLIVYCGPMWWRRRAPGLVLAAMLAVALAAAVVSRAVESATGLGIVAPLALAGIIVPVYAAGRYSTRHPGITWLTAVGAGAGSGTALVVRFLEPADLVDGSTAPQLWPAGALFMIVMASAGLGLLAAPWWLVGLLVARHHARADRRDRVALRDVADRACVPPATSGPASPRACATGCCGTRPSCSPPPDRASDRAAMGLVVHLTQTGSGRASTMRGPRSPRCANCSPCCGSAPPARPAPRSRPSPDSPSCVATPRPSRCTARRGGCRWRSSCARSGSWRRSCRSAPRPAAPCWSGSSTDPTRCGCVCGGCRGRCRARSWPRCANAWTRWEDR